MMTNCLQCGLPLREPKIRRHSKFCSKTCSNANWKKKYRLQNPPPKIPTGTRGAVSELVVSADLLGKGYAVFRALSPACGCDLIILPPNQKPLRVEVTTAAVSATGKLWYPPKDGDKHDVLAVVLRDKIHYIPPLPVA